MATRPTAIRAPRWALPVAQIAPGLVLRCLGMAEVCQSWGGLLAGLSIDPRKRPWTYPGADQGALDWCSVQMAPSVDDQTSLNCTLSWSRPPIIHIFEFSTTAAWCDRATQGAAAVSCDQVTPSADDHTSLRVVDGFTQPPKT